MSDREFLFEYRFDGHVYGLPVAARDVATARRKINAMALAMYKGEIHARIPASVPGSGLIVRLICWWRNRS